MRARRLASALVLGASLGLLACGQPGGPRPPMVVAIPPAAPAVETPALAGSRERDTTPLDRLDAALHGYLEGGDPRALFALWADDLSVRAGRERRPSPHDDVFGKDRLAAIYGWAAAHQPRVSLRLVHPRFEVDSSRASIDWAIVLSEGDQSRVAFGEHYRFERRAGEWKMVRFEYWPLSPDTLKELGPARFAELDAKVEEARQSGDERSAAYYLMLAYRFGECAEVTRRLTDATPDEPWVWDMRAKASALVGARADAETSTFEAERRRAKANRSP